VTSFPAAHFYWCTFSCFSVCLNCMETVLRFKVYELRALYQVKVLIIYNYFSGPYNVNNLSLGQLFVILMWKYLKRAKNSSCHEILLLLGRKSF